MSPHRHVIALSFLLAAIFPAAADEKPLPEADAHGDPLPKGVRLRLGTARLRDGDYIRAATLSPDGKTWAHASQRDTIRLWDVASGQLRREHKGEGLGLEHLVYAPDGRFLASCHIAGSLHLFDATDGKLVRSFGADRNHRFSDISFSADGRFLTAGEDHSSEKTAIFVWETETGKQFGPFEVLQTDNVRAALSSNGRFLATYGHYHARGNDQEGRTRSRTVQVWDVAGGKERGRLVVDGYSVTRVEFAPDARSIAVASERSKIEVWELATGQRRLQFAGRRGQGTALCFRPDGRILAAATQYGVVQRWDLATGQRLATDEGPNCEMAGLRWTTDGQLLAWGATDEAPRIWEVLTGRLLTPGGGHTASISALTFLDDGRTLATTGTDATLRFWDAQTGTEQRYVEFCKEDEYGRRSYHPSGFVFTANGRYLIGGGDFSNAARMWELPAVKEVCVLEGTERDYEPAVSLDGRTVALLGRHGGGIALWKVETGAQLGPLAGFDGDRLSRRHRGLPGVALSPSGKTVALGLEAPERNRSATEVRLWQVSTGKETHRWTVGERLAALAFTTDGANLLTVSDDGSLALREPAAGKTVRAMKGKNGSPSAPLVFSPDGRMVVLCLHDPEEATSTVQLWEMASGELRAELSGHRGAVTAVAFSPDGRTLATGGADTTVLIWDLIAVSALRTP
jgi:WD40 repeat protein